MRLASSSLRREPARSAALIAGIAAAAAAFTILCMNAAAPTVRIRGSLPPASPSRAYDILVRMPSRVTHPTAAGPVRATDLSELTGGITIAQYSAIRRLPGVAVAAPMTLVGYVPLTVVIPVPVPASAITGGSELFTVTARQRTDNGLTTLTHRNAGMTYVTASRTAPPTCSSAGLVADPASSPPLTACWSTTAGPQLQTWAGPPPSMVSVPLSWTFLLPLVAVDPTAEASLLHLDRAVVAGSYLPATGTRSGAIPVIMASAIDDDAQDDVSLARLPSSAARSYAGGLTAQQVSALLGTATEQTVASSTVTASQAYAELLSYLRGSAPARVPSYWSPSPAQYVIGPDGALVPHPVPSDGGFRTLTLHAALSGTGTEGNGAAANAGAELQAVGVFDAARIASSTATPSPYRGEQLSAADAATRRLLGGGTLAPDGNPAGYPSPGATLVMPLQDIGAFTAASAYTHTNAAAPIGSIRVRVAGATGDDAASQERVRMVAQEIVRATGLHVDVTLAASATLRTIDLAVGPDGRPALRVREVWYHSDVSTTVSSVVDPDSVALSALILLIGSAFAASAVMAALRGRRREFATLRALGWHRRRVAWLLGRDYLLVAVSAGLLATLAAYSVEAATGARLATLWPLLSIPAAVAMTLGVAWWQVRRASADRLRGAGLAAEPKPVRASSLHPVGTLGQAVRSIRRAPWRTALCILVMVVACTAFGLELAVRWVFGGVIVGSWLGLTVAWQNDPVDLAAVITVVVLAVITMADIGWRNGADRSAELRTLRAIGWPAYGVAWLAAGEALLLGLAAGLAASVLDVAAIVAVVHRPPPGLALVPAPVVGLGAAMSLITVVLSAVAERVSESTRLT